jgi:hypothetical protein
MNLFRSFRLMMVGGGLHSAAIGSIESQPTASIAAQGVCSYVDGSTAITDFAATVGAPSTASAFEVVRFKVSRPAAHVCCFARSVFSTTNRRCKALKV